MRQGRIADGQVKRLKLLALLAMIDVLAGCGQTAGAAATDTGAGGGQTDAQADAAVLDVLADVPEDAAIVPDVTGTDVADVDLPDVAPDTLVDADLPDVSPDAAADAKDAEADVAPDVAKDVPTTACEFPANPAAGQAGAVCAADGDCASGVCAAAQEGLRCAPTCDGNCCPFGWTCDKGAATPVCRPKWAALCAPCVSDAECAAVSPGSLCVKHGEQGSYCATKCAATKDCPADYKCSYSYGTAGQDQVCVLSVGACDCSPLATAAGAKTSCANSNGAGTCKGQRSCLAAGLSLCDAQVPAPETCNGVDDDCNGLTDDGLVGMDVDSDGIPDCTDPDIDGDGSLNADDCAPKEAAIHPGAVELCNGADDNCVGGTDEGFPDLDNDGLADCVDPDRDGDGVANAQDCAPSDGGVFQGNPEVCDGKDQNCNGKTDEGFPDQDGDKLPDCVDPDIDGDGVDNAADCSPTVAAVHPGATEACDGIDNDCSGTTDEGFPDADQDKLADCIDPDDDNDGSSDAADCAPTNAAIHPGATEVCNGLDDDCDGKTDPGCDDDGDGYCDASLPADPTSVACPQGAGDCDDVHASVHPGAVDVCDALDNDCDGNTDPGCDVDGDGYCIGNLAPSGTCIHGGGDCNDADPNAHPGATETCDNADQNCDGDTDEGCDADKDGYCTLTVPAGTKLPACPKGDGDCDDAKGAIHPGATDVCNSVDDNCDGVTDAGCDQDGDGYCAGTAPPSVGCIHGGGDCNDGDAGIHPTAAEVCDDVDNDCVAGVDNGCDDDGDGWCNAASVIIGTPAKCVNGVNDCDDKHKSVYPGAPDICDGLANGCDGKMDVDCNKDGDYYCDAGRIVVGTPYTCLAGGGDCDDNNDKVYPTATDVCDLLDNDCDGATDPGCDADNDGYCATGKAWIFGSGACKFGAQDCDDQHASVYPNATEICDGLDNNCDTYVDDGCDDDGDGWCDANMTTVGKPPVCTHGGGDCNDSAASVTPGHTEVCDGLDNDCDGKTDPGCDDDKDGFCDATMVTIGSPSSCPLGGGDCNDNSAAVKPGAIEVCDNLDNNCGSGTDEGCNDDGDAYCDANMTTTGFPIICPSGGNDCDDLNSQINPGQTEVCDDLNNNCVAGVDEGCDDDNDKVCDGQMVVVGFPKICPYGPGDCNDQDPNVGAIGAGAGCVEICDGKDNNNDSQTDENCDQDKDGYCDAARTTVGKPAVCPSGGGDCADNNPSINPGKTENCSTAIDDNCDGLLDSDGAIGCTNWWVDADGDGFGGQKVCYCSNPGSKQTFGAVGVDNSKTLSLAPIGAGTAGAVFDLSCPTSYVATGVSGFATSSPIYLAQFNLVCRKLNTDGTLGVTANVSSPNFGSGPAFSGTCPNGELLVTEWGDQNGSPAYISRLGGHCSTLSRVGSKYAGWDDYMPNSPVLFDGGGTGTTEQACPVGYAVTGFSGNGSDRIWQLGYKCSPVSISSSYQTYVSVGGDCNDFDAGTSPNSTEICDNLDNNCSGSTDEGCDADGDKYCTSAKTVIGTPTICNKGGGDCNDADASIHPGGVELCDGIDNDCNSVVDPGCDDDKDGYCDVNFTTVGKPYTCPSGGGDCSDGNAAIHPGAAEVCDDVDQDCGGVTDEGCDDDGDQYCDAAYSVVGAPKKCPKGKGDCNDTSAVINPAASETCDDIDNNCSGAADEGCDADGDGWCRSTATFVGTPKVCTKGKTDCNDSSASVYPGAPEVCDNLDNSCSGKTDTGCDDDNDDYCDANMTFVVSATCPKGGGDCNDAVATTNPGAKDICGNGVDDDCSGSFTSTADSENKGTALQVNNEFSATKWLAFPITPTVSGTLAAVNGLQMLRWSGKAVSTTLRIYNGIPGAGGTMVGASTLTVTAAYSWDTYNFPFGGVSVTKGVTYYAVILASDANNGFMYTNKNTSGAWKSTDSGVTWTGCETYPFSAVVTVNGVDGPVCQ